MHRRWRVRRSWGRPRGCGLLVRLGAADWRVIGSANRRPAYRRCSTSARATRSSSSRPRRRRSWSTAGRPVTTSSPSSIGRGRFPRRRRRHSRTVRPRRRDRGTARAAFPDRPAALRAPRPSLAGRGRGRRRRARAGRGGRLRIGSGSLAAQRPLATARAARRNRSAGADPNTQALVLLARWRWFSMLLTADAEAGEVPIDPGPVDVLKVAHHGSEDAGLGALLDRTTPRLAVISVGADNPYGHPAASTLADARPAQGANAANGQTWHHRAGCGSEFFRGPGRRRLRRSQRMAEAKLGFRRRRPSCSSQPGPMDVKVASKVGHALTRSLGGLSLADGSMLLRLRRASIALLGLVGAVGLGLVFFISQIGWPGVLSGPVAGNPDPRRHRSRRDRPDACRAGDRHREAGHGRSPAKARAAQRIVAPACRGAREPATPSSSRAAPECTQAMAPISRAPRSRRPRRNR